MKIAREKCSASNIEYIQADDKTFLATEHYNVVFCNTVIHWIKDKKSLYKRIYDSLHPGGLFAFTTPDGGVPIPSIGEKLFDELLGP